jgi:cytochrome c peroxidase
MKKKLIIGALVLVVLLFTIYRISVKAPDGVDYSDRAKVASIFIKGGCISCHSANPELPFYANVPLMGDIVKADVSEGYRMYDMQPFMDALLADESLNPVDVAKVEKVAMDKSMPLAKYYLMHWGSQMTKAKRDVIISWARSYREAHYNDGLAGVHAGEPVRPIAEALPVDGRKVVLGKELYHDVRLSGDNTVSCASCHGLETAGVDNKQYSEGVQGQKGGVNAPTTFNAVYNFVQFWDGRAATLADQAAGPPLNPVEMASSSFDEIIAKLAADKHYVEAFAQVYPDGITQANITDAIEEFEMTLLTPNSPFDKYLRGDNNAISAEAKQGYELFKEYGCATCHVGPNLGGESYELMGLRDHYFADRGLELTEEDNGRYKQTQQERDRHRFKVPGLRNVALTWPYYHDGTRATLEQAVRDMGTYQSGVNLTDGEVNEIVAFLNTLTGEYEGKPLTNVNSK